MPSFIKPRNRNATPPTIERPAWAAERSSSIRVRLLSMNSKPRLAIAERAAPMEGVRDCPKRTASIASPLGGRFRAIGRAAALATVLLIGWTVLGASADWNVAGAVEPSGPLRQRMVFGPPRVPSTLDRNAHVPPGHERFQAVPVPAYPWLSNGLNVPTYQWGYFGARSRPRVVEQHGYAEDYRQWSFRPGS